MKKLLLIILLLSQVLGSFVFAKNQNIPELKQHVTDQGKLLNSEQRSHIEHVLGTLKKTEGSEIAVLIVNTTKPESLEDFSMRVVEKWKLGRKNVDDGVLLLIAKSDRKIRIEVGYGLEGAITDLSAGRIINEYITPEFRRGNFYQGILAGVGQISNLIKGEPLPEPTTSQGSGKNGPGAVFPLMMFGSFFLSMFLVPLFGRLITISLISVGGSAIIWFLSHDPFLTGLSFIFLVILSSTFSASRSSSYRDGGGYGDGFGGGDGFSGGGGGFSGGGGGFGGGGASGGW